MNKDLPEVQQLLFNGLLSDWVVALSNYHASNTTYYFSIGFDLIISLHMDLPRAVLVK